MTHYTVQFNGVIPELATVGSLDRERFQGTLEDWRGTVAVEQWQIQRGAAVGAAAPPLLAQNFSKSRLFLCKRHTVRRVHLR